MEHFDINPSLPGQLSILLADDDYADRLFFKKALQVSPFHIRFTTIDDGEKLMAYLNENTTKLPDVLFLDHNMPRKSGSECLSEIKSNPKIEKLPVIIYSNYLHEDVADVLYENGAHFYMRKTELPELKKVLQRVISLIIEKKFTRPSRDQFILSPMEI
jgi:CheY-like chemotaxis protein